MAVKEFDPRAQLVWLAALLLCALAGGLPGLATAAFVALCFGRGHVRGLLSLLRGLAPIAILLALLQLLSGRAAEGAWEIARLLTLAVICFAFARTTQGERLAEGLIRLRVPHAVVFVLVTGAELIPWVAQDLETVRTAMVLRGVPMRGSLRLQVNGWRMMLVPLIVRTVRRGLQLGEAMEARAYGARVRRSSRYSLTWRRQDTYAVVAAILYVALVLVLANPAWHLSLLRA